MVSITMGDCAAWGSLPVLTKKHTKSCNVCDLMSFFVLSWPLYTYL